MAQNFTEKKAAKIREFLFTLVMACVCYEIGRLVRDVLTSYKVIGDLIAIALFCVLAYFVITRYAASYTYSVGGGVLKVTRSIGHRVTAVETEISSIKKISASKPDKKPEHIYRMTPHILPNKRTRYVIFGRGKVEKMIVFEPSAELLKALKADKHIERK